MTQASEPMEYLYVHKKIADSIRGIQAPEAIAKEIIDYFSKSKKDLHSNLEELDFDTNKFKQDLATARTKLQEVVQTELDETTKIWDYYFKHMKTLKSLADEAIKASKEVTTSINLVQNTIGYIDVERFKELVTVLERIENMSESNKKILNLIVTNNSD